MTRMPLGERRERLMAAAFELIAEEGVAGVTTRKVAGRAGMPLASFHYAFDSRDQLLAAMLGQVVQDNLRFVLETPLASDSLHECLNSFFDGMVARIAQTADVQRAAMELLMWSLEGSTPSSLMLPYQMEGIETLGGVFAQLAKATRIRWTVPVDILALQVYVIWDGMCLRYLQSRAKEQLSPLRHAFVVAFESLAEPAPVS